ncbi:hypothetical protein N6H14_30600 [Paenibacillus sp. CC-CFT747]|nr:hypothetical protein N6H14_30600 [Paenibacillus sp. CC-CFT747]
MTNHEACRKLPASMAEALRLLADRLAPFQGAWMVGGSCGLLLHGLRLPNEPRDLDLYADRNHVGTMHRLLADRAEDEQQHSRTDRYDSVLSHYRVNGVNVELVGGFEIRSTGSLYRVETDVLKPYAAVPSIDKRIRVMPLAHELVFNLLREREDRYEPVAAAMKANPAAHMPALGAIVQGNRLSLELLRKLESLTEYPLTKEGDSHAPGDSFPAG